MQLSTKTKIRRLVGSSMIATFAFGGLAVSGASASVPHDDGIGPAPIPALPAPAPGIPQIPPDDEGRPPGSPQIPVPVPVPGGGA